MNRKNEMSSAERDVVILHQFPRGRLTPSTSPFVMKLETYLRMADIKYEVILNFNWSQLRSIFIYFLLQPEFKKWFGPTGKAPWISLNGEHMGDSQLIMEFLAKKFNKNFSSHLSPEELAVATSMRIMAEEHLVW